MKKKKVKAKKPTVADCVRAINKLNREIVTLNKKLSILRKRVELGPTNENIFLWKE